jgi:hypothetical protein
MIATLTIPPGPDRPETIAELDDDGTWTCADPDLLWLLSNRYDPGSGDYLYPSDGAFGAACASAAAKFLDAVIEFEPKKQEPEGTIY